MAYDYKKEFKELYNPPARPEVLRIGPMHFAAVSGTGDPNSPKGDFQKAIEMLYSLLYTIKMSKKTSWQPEGYFDFVVPPLEGLWQSKGDPAAPVDYDHKEDFVWTAMIRLPDFLSEEDFEKAKELAERKKKIDLSRVQYLDWQEGLIMQCLHKGSYDDEPATIKAMHEAMDAAGYQTDFSESRRHHEIYLSDPRKTAPEKRKTILRFPIRS